MDAPARVKTILFLAANPRNTSRLRLGEEIREIDERLWRARKREQFALEQRWAVRPNDISQAMLDFEPQIVHFSGHGTGMNGLAVEDETGRAQLIRTTALAGLFKLFRGQVECVLLNACYSEAQADAISQHVPYVIGMSQSIGDRAAIQFAVGFYAALGAGRSYKDAYEFGCRAIEIANLPEELTPKIKIKIPWPPGPDSLLDPDPIPTPAWTSGKLWFHLLGTIVLWTVIGSSTSTQVNKDRSDLATQILLGYGAIAGLLTGLSDSLTWGLLDSLISRFVNFANLSRRERILIRLIDGMLMGIAAGALLWLCLGSFFFSPSSPIKDNGLIIGLIFGIALAFLFGLLNWLNRRRR